MKTPRALVEVGTWRVSTRSSSSGSTNCVEVGTWRTSSRSGSSGSGNNCVEVAACTTAAHGVAIRDSKHRDGAVLATDRPQWTGFLAGLRNGQYDS